MNGCLPTVPFRTLVGAVRDAGFDSLSLWPNVWRHAQRREGMTLAGMRALLDDHGLRVTDLDGCRDWVPPDDPDAALRSPISRRIPRAEYFEVAGALGATTIVAIPVSTQPLDRHREADGLAALCVGAASHGLRVALEYVGWEMVHDLPTARALISAAPVPAGLVVDIGHHVRGGSSLADLDELEPADVYTVQLCDGPLAPPADLVDEATFGRQAPGRGEFPVAEFVSRLERRGVRCSVGAEIYSPRHERMEPAAVVAEMFRLTAPFTDEATTPGGRPPRVSAS